TLSTNTLIMKWMYGNPVIRNERRAQRHAINIIAEAPVHTVLPQATQIAIKGTIFLDEKDDVLKVRQTGIVSDVDGNAVAERHRGCVLRLQLYRVLPRRQAGKIEISRI